MARRKHAVLDDGDDSDDSLDSDTLDVDFDNDPLAKEERERFENPYKRKRRRKNGKEDAIYGVFGDDSDEETQAPKKKTDWTKAPSFVTGDKPVKLDEDMDVESDKEEEESESEKHSSESGSASDSDGSEGEDEAGEDDERSNKSESSRAPSPRVRLEEEDEPEQPRMGGMGFSAASAFSKGEEPQERPRTGGLGFSGPSSASAFSRGGIGSSSRPEATPSEAPRRGGIGSTTSSSPAPRNPEPSTSASPSPIPGSVPSAFASRSRSFMPAAPSPKSVPLPAAEAVHFNKLQGTFGARMLAKMGWQAGTGLGAAGEGIVTPIESKLRPQKMGIAFKGFKEKTAQSKMEAKRRGEAVSDDEKDPKIRKMKKKAKEAQEKRADAWKRPKKVKTKVEHKTYEQILAEAGEAPVPSIGKIIDATGAVPREVSSLADISLNTWTPSNDPTRIPEVRHNIRLIADACKVDLDALAREAKSLQERKKFVSSEDARLSKKVEDEADLIARLQQVQLVTNDINGIARELSSAYEVTLEPFSPLFQKLINEYYREFDKYRLDEIIVAAIAPVLRRMIARWNPLEDHSFILSTFRAWRKGLKINEVDKNRDAEIDVYGAKTVSSASANPEKPMTPFESLLWNVWLPRVRTAINNEWSADEPQPAVQLYEAWSSFLPPFIRDNLLDQLILPKVQKAVADWNPKTAKVSLQAIVFPWLPHVGLRLQDVVGDARRKIKTLLRSWTVETPIPTDLLAWKDVFEAAEWDNMLLKYILPKLGATLRADFRVNPRDQKMEPLQRVLAWSNMFRSSVFSQLFETEFFPKWLDVLHIWLIQPKVSFEEVAQWYSFWKDSFPTAVRDMPGVSRGFTRGLQLMNKAIELGPEAPTKLVRPDFLKEIQRSASPRPGVDDTKPVRPSARTHEITFRAIAEEYASSRNLLFIPTGRAHGRSRMPLYKISRSADGKKGLLVYILDDAIWAPPEGGGETDDFVAISLDSMVLRATAS